jgi:uncharacterized protein YuzB (UPF0349 family)
VTPSPSEPGAGGPPVVEYCVNNVDAETRKRLADAPVECRGAPCLERCGTCRTTAYLVVDGEVWTGESHAALVSALAEVSA